MVVRSTFAVGIIAVCLFHTSVAQAIYPIKRYSADWVSLDPETLADAIALNYNQARWDLENQSSREQLRYSKLIERLNEAELATLNSLVPREESWDCWINHYSGYSWDDIEEDSNLYDAFRTLGWWRYPWEVGSERTWPASDSKVWVDLADAEKAAARKICYNEKLWDEIPLHMWSETDFSGEKTAMGPTTFPSDSPSTFPSDSPSMAPSTTPTEFNKKNNKESKEDKSDD